MPKDYRLPLDMRSSKIKIPVLRHHMSVSILLLLIFESILFVVAFALGMSIELDANLGKQLLQTEPYAYAVLMVAGLLILGLYRIHNDHSFRGILARIVLGFALTAQVIILLNYALPITELPHPGKAAIYALLLSFMIVLALRSLHLYLIKQSPFKHRVLVLGVGRKANTLADLRRDTDLSDATIVGYIKCQNDQTSVDPKNIIDIDPRDLDSYASNKQVDEILIATDDRRRGLPLEQLLACKMRGVRILDLCGFLERETGKIRLDLINPSSLIFSDGFDQSALRRLLGRLMDICGAVILILLLSPVMLLAAIAVLFDGQRGGGIIYRQPRVGLRGRVFDILKLRTMIPDAETNGAPRWAEEGDPRITKVGGILRKYRLDELPQLFNVLKGEMSLVGPRPERPEFVRQLRDSIPYYDERHRVKPGITGWAQLNYPYGSSEQDALEKLQYDLYYVKNNSVLFDIAVLLQTGDVVLFRKGSR